MMPGWLRVVLELCLVATTYLAVFGESGLASNIIYVVVALNVVLSTLCLFALRHIPIVHRRQFAEYFERQELAFICDGVTLVLLAAGGWWWCTAGQLWHIVGFAMMRGALRERAT